MSDTPEPLPVAAPSVASSVIDVPQVFEFVLNLQRSLDLNEVSNVAVNDGRLLWEVDRVSLVLCRGRKSEVVAVSGQESVHPRGNLIRSMRRIADHIIAAGVPLQYAGSFDSLPPQLEEPLADFVQESGTRFLLIMPLFAPERLVQPEPLPGIGKSPRQERQKIGALIIEQMTNSEPSPALKRSFDFVVDHVAAAVFNARTHGSIFLLPVWRSVGRFLEWLRGRRLAAAAAVLFLALAASVALIVVPWTYRVDATGRLMPVIQREVFAPWDGHVIELLAEGGQRVEAGQPLLKLRNDELAAELVTVENQIHEKRKLLATLYAQRDDAERQGNRDESLKAQGRAIETKVEIEGALLKLEILKERRDRLTVRAPITGVITTFQVEQLLLNRPVRRGEVLMQVMDDSAEWHLELEIAEHRVGRILRAQQRAGKAADDAKANLLAVEYRLLTQPESSYLATLNSLSTRTVTAEARGSVMEGRAAVDKQQLPLRTIGADVRARIDCGKSSLGDVLFGDIIEFVQSYLWW